MARANSPGGTAGSWILASERSMRANFHWLTAICSTRDFFHVVLGHPGGGEPLQELVEFRLVFAGDDRGFGAQAVDEGIEADAVLARRTFGAGRVLRIA